MGEYYFNTRTGQVEQVTDKGQGKDLLGPYASREEAEQALATANQRTEEWDREDREWRGEE